MVDLRLLSGAPKCTIIETFNGKVMMLHGGEKKEFGSLDDCKKHVSESGFETNVSHIFGTSIGREILKAKGGVQ